MNLNPAEQPVYDSGFACGLGFASFDRPDGLSDTDQVIWYCGLHAGLAEGLKRKQREWQSAMDAIKLNPPSKPPPVTDADRDEVDAAAVAWDKLPWDDRPLDPRDDA